MASAVIFFVAVVIGIAFGQTPSPTPWLDPFANGKWGNPGGRIHLCKKTIEAVHSYTAEAVARSIQLINMPEISLNVGTGTVTIGPPRIKQISLGQYDYEMVPSNRIRSRFFDGLIQAGGVWSYKQMYGAAFGSSYQVSVTNMELNVTNEFGRSADGKPTIKTVECKAYLGEHRVDIKNVAAEFSVIENCKLDYCLKVREVFEKAFCDIFSAFVRDMLNNELQSYPNRMPIVCESHKIDYSLMGNPTVLKNTTCLRADTEARFIWQASSGVPFYPPEMNWVDRGRMFSFQFSDYTFNTLLFQAHQSGYKYSASELASQSASGSMEQLLSLNCGTQGTPVTPTTKTSTTTKTTTTTKPTTKPSGRKLKANRGPPAQFAPVYKQPQCLGSLFDGFANFGPYSSSDLGDIVFKTNQKASAIYIESDKNGYFDGGFGTLVVYGPVPKVGSRQVLAQADVKLMRGQIIPKLNKLNVTASIKLTALKLAIPPPQGRAITEEWMEQFAQFSMPILTDMINQFLGVYAQFPLPLPEKYVCTSPEFSVQPRTMQLDCDIERTGECALLCCNGKWCGCCDDLSNL